MSATKKFKNTSDRVQEFKIWGDPNMAPSEYEVQPGEECHIPNGYAGNFIKRRAPGLTACDELPSDEEQLALDAQAKLDDVAALAKEAEELQAKKDAEEAAELAKLEEEEAAELASKEEAPKKEGLFGGLSKDKKSKKDKK